MVRGKYQWKCALLVGLALLSMTPAPLSAQAVRRNVRAQDAQQMLASYARAIDVMRRLPANDPHNWTFQANLHGYPGDTPEPSPLFAQCQHGHWWFLPWHRAYLHAFEKIIRVHSQDANFALPYWDWSEAASRSLPTAFRNPGSPLFDGTRRGAVNNGSAVPDESVVVNDVNFALNLPEFFTLAFDSASTTFGGLRLPMASHAHFGPGALELSPHNYMHGWVGGNMSDPNRAARDPIFFLHHANIDRLWEVWLAPAGRRNPTDDPIWMNQRFTLYDENKRVYTVAVRDLLNTRTQLNYVYADPLIQVARAAPGGNPGPQAKIPAGLRANPRTPIVLVPQRPWGELKNIPMHIELRLDEVQAAPLKQLARKNKLSKGELILVIEGISYDGPLADSSLEAYLNLPHNANLASVKRQHLADRCTFFGSVKNGTAHLRLGESFERLRTQPGFRPEVMTITLQRHWFGAEAPANARAVTFKSVTLLVAQ